MRPHFLDRPGLWTSASRDGRSAVDRACAIERPQPRRSVIGDVIFACVLGTLGALLLAHWLAR